MRDVATRLHAAGEAGLMGVLPILLASAGGEWSMTTSRGAVVAWGLRDGQL